MSGNEPIRRSMARVEFLACMETVESMLGQGFSRQLIYERLKKEGRVSMAYVTFAKLIVKVAQNALILASLHPATEHATPLASTPATENKQKTPAPPQRKPSIIKADTEEFPDPRTMNPEESY